MGLFTALVPSASQLPGVWSEDGRVGLVGFGESLHEAFCRVCGSVVPVGDRIGGGETSGIDWKTVKRFDKSALEEELNPPDLEGLRVLAVDEIAIKKGHRYATVIIDFETRRVVWAVEDRTEEALGSFYEMLGEDRCDLIEAVAMDMWKPYENATRRYCRNAEIVYDKFHILSHFSKVIDKVRNAEFKRAEEEDKAVLKGTKYLLLRNWDNLKNEQKDRLWSSSTSTRTSTSSTFSRKNSNGSGTTSIRRGLNFFLEWFQNRAGVQHRASHRAGHDVV